MKLFVCFLICSILLSCSQKQEPKTPQSKLLAKTEKAYGNIHVKETFEKHYPYVKVYRDSVIKQDFLSQPLKRATCMIANDFYDDGRYYRQKTFLINDTLTLNVIEKQDSQYVYFYKGRPFDIINNINGELAPDAGYHFFLEDRDCWQLGSNKYLMAETPSGWCGTILQFEFYQMFDLNKMQITQFIDKRME